MSRETHAHGARSTGASALWNHVREDSRELFHLLGDVSPSPERSRSGSFWRPRWRRLPVAEREHVDLPAAHTARSVVDHDADGGGDDLQLLRHIVRRDTVIMGKTARTDAAGICKDEGDVLENRVLGSLCVIFAPLARCLGFGSGDRRRITVLAGLLTERGGRLDEGLRLGAHVLSVQTGGHDTRDQVLSHGVGQVEATRRAQRTERTPDVSREFDAPERTSATRAARDRMVPAGAEDERSLTQRQHRETST